MLNQKRFHSSVSGRKPSRTKTLPSCDYEIAIHNAVRTSLCSRTHIQGFFTTWLRQRGFAFRARVCRIDTETKKRFGAFRSVMKDVRLRFRRTPPRFPP
ncbi:hypothetical protein DPMN_149137 [Dreissena polymorpha]|uniref:Uncharacterized protein n=1 Tax=Dreissena polymorpha TaxID=45954 RepID=A0A9D4FC61_DREPO|nr:hypothetical protein DPMN_149137 [Dreissena polymorpha]